jgi:hypothetical protein
MKLRRIILLEENECFVKNDYFNYLSLRRTWFREENCRIISISDENGNVQYCGYIAIKTVQGYVSPWNPSQMDMLAEDWIIVE